MDDQLMVRLAFEQAAPQLLVIYLNDGIEAIHYLDNCRETPALLLTDLNMTLFNGLELLAHIRKHSLTQAIPTVVLTTSGTDDDRQRCYRAGANAFLVKPDNLTGLADLIRCVMRVWLVDRR